jgi:hypothetical protein
MRKRDALRMVTRLVHGKVRDVGFECAGIQRGDDRGLVHDAFSREVEDDRLVLEQRQPFGVDEILGGRQQRNVHGEEFRLRKQRLQRVHPPHTGRRAVPRPPP